MAMNQNQVEQMLRRHDNDIGAIYEILTDHTGRLDRIETKVDGLEQRFDGLEQRFDGLTQQMGEVLTILRTH